MIKTKASMLDLLWIDVVFCEKILIRGDLNFFLEDRLPGSQNLAPLIRVTMGATSAVPLGACRGWATCDASPLLHPLRHT